MAIVAIILEILLALAFLMAGGSKLASAQRMRENFKRWGYPQWFRSVTGLVEVIGAAGMIVGIFIPAIGALAGIWLGITMLGALFTHVRVNDTAPQFASPAVLLVLSLAVIVLRWVALMHAVGVA